MSAGGEVFGIDPGQNPAFTAGYGAAAIGDGAVAMGSHAIGVACACGLELHGRARPGAAPIEAALIYLGHADVCERVNPSAVDGAARILADAGVTR